MILSNYWKVFTTGKQFCLQYHLHDGILIWTLVLCFKDCVLCHKGMKLHPGWGHKLLNRNSPWEDINLVNINLNFIRDIFVIFCLFFFCQAIFINILHHVIIRVRKHSIHIGKFMTLFSKITWNECHFFFQQQKKILTLIRLFPWKHLSFYTIY